MCGQHEMNSRWGKLALINWIRKKIFNLVIPLSFVQIQCKDYVATAQFPFVRLSKGETSESLMEFVRPFMYEFIRGHTINIWRGERGDIPIKRNIKQIVFIIMPLPRFVPMKNINFFVYFWVSRKTKKIVNILLFHFFSSALSFEHQSAKRTEKGGRRRTVERKQWVTRALFNHTLIIWTTRGRSHVCAMHSDSAREHTRGAILLLHIKTN